MDVTIGIPQMSLVVRMYSPAKGSKLEQAPPDVDEGDRAGCSDVGPGRSILRSPSSPVANVNDPKINLVPRGNLMSNVQGAMVFSDRS
jgi:hypothetical protein